MNPYLGPSLAQEPAVFEQVFGADPELLMKQNSILRKYLMAIGMRDHLHKIQSMPPAPPTWQTRFKKLLARA